MKRALFSKGQCGKNRALKEKWPKLREQEARMWFEPGRSEHAGVLQIVSPDRMKRASVLKTTCAGARNVSRQPCVVLQESSRAYKIKVCGVPCASGQSLGSMKDFHMESSGPDANGVEVPPVCAEGTQQRLLELNLGIYILAGNIGFEIT